jgi:hypothetical protein
MPLRAAVLAFVGPTVQRAVAVHAVVWWAHPRRGVRQLGRRGCVRSSRAAPDIAAAASGRRKLGVRMVARLTEEAPPEPSIISSGSGARRYAVSALPRRGLLVPAVPYQVPDRIDIRPPTHIAEGPMSMSMSMSMCVLRRTLPYPHERSRCKYTGSAKRGRNTVQLVNSSATIQSSCTKYSMCMVSLDYRTSRLWCTHTTVRVRVLSTTTK